jgi:meso-butanediol dehydrogenase / (S,S)-butanediol dehydrogenase / diacetyl reductase
VGSPRFAGKVVVVTGGSSGIGRATVIRFAREGAAVMIGDINDDLGHALVDELSDGKVAFQKTDVSKEQELVALMEAAVRQFGALDILFSNAGLTAMGNTPDLSPDLWRRVIETDLSSVFYAARAAIPHMRQQGKGVIINNASISGMMGDYGMVVYNAAKGGVVNYTRALALDHARENIRVNAICPGAIDTPLFEGIKAVPKLYKDWMNLIPMGRIGTPEEIAGVVAFLASDDASYMTGAIITIDGGQTASTGTPNFNAYLDDLKAQYN